MYICFSTRFRITCLFKKRGSWEDFSYNLVEETKTGKVDNIINTKRSRLEITGFKSIVPSPRHVRQATAEMEVHFSRVSPRKRFLVFEVTLFLASKPLRFFLLKTSELQGLCVDIWGDSYSVEVTRLAFRLLDVDISVQSTPSVFYFASKSILF